MDTLSNKKIFREYTRSSGIYPREQLNRMGRMLGNIKGQDGVRVDATPYGITIHGNASKEHYRFELVASTDGSGSPTVRVYVGKWTRNGNITELAPDLDQEYFTLPFASFTTDSDNFIYLELDEVEQPFEVTVTAATTIPVQTGDDVYWVLGNANFDSDAVLTLTQYWYGGDIDDVSASSGNVDSDYDCPLTESLEKDTCEDGADSDAVTRTFNRLAGFKTPTTVAATGSFGVAENEYTLVTRKAGNGTDTPSVVRYWIPVDISVVTNVTYSTVTHKLELTKATVTVLKQVVDASNPYLIEQAEECVAT